jgi:8-oxo-dGTP pyrophosphatase MutT (NUDIX family)
MTDAKRQPAKITNTDFDWTRAVVEWHCPWFKVERNGSWYRSVPRPGVVAVPYSGVLGGSDCRFVLVRQPRPAVSMNTLEFPRGGIDPDEDQIRAACREALEETGFPCDPGRARVIGRVAPDTSGSAVVVPVIAVPANLSRRFATDGEASAVEILSTAELMRAVARGEIACGLTLSALMLIHTHASAS